MYIPRNMGKGRTHVQTASNFVASYSNAATLSGGGNLCQVLGSIRLSTRLRAAHIKQWRLEQHL